MTLRSRPRTAMLAALVLVLIVPWIGGAQAKTPAAQNSNTPAPPPGLDAEAARVLKTFEVPGMAVAIVKNGKVVVAKGYGIRRIGEPAPVDPRTLFGIASNTKVFTATALGLLVEEGKLDWDAPVINYLPWFAMYDPYVTREITVRDLLVHRSGLGLGAGDLLFWPPTTYSRKEIVRRLRYIKPAASFRYTYAYDNFLYCVAGEVIEAVSGKTWEDFLSERILAKVGMTSSTVLHSGAAREGDIAATHAKVDGIVRVVNPSVNENTNPAGGINSCAQDMAKWTLVLLGQGRLPDGTRLFSEGTYRELTTLVTPMPISEPEPELAVLKPNFNGYALGLRVKDYRGRKVVTHTGGLAGYVSQVWLMPELNLGITVLTNQEMDAAFAALTMFITDYYLQAPKTDWVDAYVRAKAREDARTAEIVKKAAVARDASSKPSLALEKYAGTYRDAWYGDIDIAFENGKLVMRFTKSPSLVGDLEHWQQDTFLVRWRDRELRADAYVTFSLNPDGSIEQAKMRPASPDVDFSYDFQDLLLKPAGK
jgi:CubicO group peptidase (beta-lactamase class C family)